MDHSSNRHHDNIMPVASNKRSSDGHDDIIMPVATSKYCSNMPMTSSFSSLLYFSYFNELVKSLKMYINLFSNGKS
jgi:hypothetical protein